MYEYIERNYRALREEIDALAALRGSGSVRLVAVTKSGTDEELLALAAAGVTDVGENRPQELVRRGALLREAGFTPRLHEIGNLQKNKVRHIINDVYMIHSLDSVELAREIDKRAAAAGRRVPVLIEINSAGEEAKGGIDPTLAEDFFLEVRGMPSLIVSGLMTMGPVSENAEDMRPYFRLTKELFDRLQAKYGFEGEPTLSMGMSDSYRIAIEEGATLVRVGHKIFEREESNNV